MLSIGVSVLTIYGIGLFEDRRLYTEGDIYVLTNDGVVKSGILCPIKRQGVETYLPTWSIVRGVSYGLIFIFERRRFISTLFRMIYYYTNHGLREYSYVNFLVATAPAGLLMFGDGGRSSYNYFAKTGSISGLRVIFLRRATV